MEKRPRRRSRWLTDRKSMTLPSNAFFHSLDAAHKSRRGVLADLVGSQSILDLFAICHYCGPVPVHLALGVAKIVVVRQAEL